MARSVQEASGDASCGKVKTSDPFWGIMSTGWHGDEKRMGKETPKVFGGRRRPGGVVVARKPKPDVPKPPLPR